MELIYLFIFPKYDKRCDSPYKWKVTRTGSMEISLIISSPISRLRVQSYREFYDTLVLSIIRFSF